MELLVRIRTMSKRTQVPDSTQADVLVQSRRRCCVCFGLNRDTEVKKGQIAHLDRDRNNNHIDNLVFLCFDHHDEYDSRTSQSKSLSRKEIEKYREELYHQFDNWSARIQRDELLSFLAFYAADLDSMVKAALKAAGTNVWYDAKSLALEVLTNDSADYCDADLYIPYLTTLDYYASWGWLTFSSEESEEEDGTRVFITVERKPVCEEVAKHIRDQGK